MYDVQPSLASFVTTGTACVPSTTTVSMSGPGAITQSTGTSVPIYPDFFLSDILDSTLNHFMENINKAISR